MRIRTRAVIEATLATVFVVIACAWVSSAGTFVASLWEASERREDFGVVAVMAGHLVS